MRCSYLKGIWEDSKILQKERKVLSKDLGVIMLLDVSKVSLEARRWWRMPSNVRENTLSAQNSIAGPWKMRPISIKWGAESRHLQTCKGATNRPPQTHLRTLWRMCSTEVRENSERSGLGCRRQKPLPRARRQDEGCPGRGRCSKSARTEGANGTNTWERVPRGSLQNWVELAIAA